MTQAKIIRLCGAVRLFILVIFIGLRVCINGELQYFGTSVLESIHF